MVLNNFNIKENNSFKISEVAHNFYTFSSIEELQEIIVELKHKPFFILGAGNNVLFTQPVENILHSKIEYIQEIETNEDYSLFEVGSGSLWDDFVAFSVEQGFYGAENLSAIPSSIGATAVQNIGAYGAEAKHIIDSVFALDTFFNDIVAIKNTDCEFGYRDSVFKRSDRYIILSVVYKLSKKKNINIEYKDLQQKIEELNLSTSELNSKIISQIIRDIRNSKLPSVELVGNAGSFFKNPEITLTEFENLKQLLPEITGYKTEKKVKISAAYLIEKAGLKGYKYGDAGVSEKHSLILVNYGNAKGEEIKDIAKLVVDTVMAKFKIKLEPEVKIL